LIRTARDSNAAFRALLRCRNVLGFGLAIWPVGDEGVVRVADRACIADLLSVPKGSEGVIEPILAQPPEPPLTAPYEYEMNSPTASPK